MSELLQTLIDSSNLPALTAFLVGLMAAISPCPLATNIAAVSFIAKDMTSGKKAFIGSLFYALGRVSSYTLLATLIYFGLSTFNVANIFQKWGDKVIGPILIIIGLIMLGVIKLDFLNLPSLGSDKLKEKLSKSGYFGHFLLGALFALAFCPYSGVLFFGILIPLVLSSPAGLLLPPIFGIGTAVPVIIFGFILAFTTQKVAPLFTKIKNLEKIMRIVIAVIFLIIGFYYLQYTLTMIKSYF